MSRIGKRPLAIPAKTEVTVADAVLTVKGPLGTLSRRLHPQVRVLVEGGNVVVQPADETRLGRALWGTYAAHTRNMLAGVQKQYMKKLVLDGVGYRMSLAGTTLTMSLGFSHPVVLQVPDGVKAVVEKNELTLTSCDKELLGQFAANVRALKKPEPYKGKGFHYSDEVVRRKQGKKAA